MRIGIITTDGGPHPAEKLASATAWKIADLVRVSDAAPDPALSEIERQAILENRARFTAARGMLEVQVTQILLRHHSTVQNAERDALKEHGSKRLDASHDHACDSVCAEVVAATKGTALEAHFARPETQARIHEILHLDSAHNAHVERSWHADRHPHDAHSKAFRARHGRG